jgi:choline-sulfatase
MRVKSTWIAANGLELLENAPEDRPWHLQVSFAGPHDPLDVTEEMHGWYRDPGVDFPEPTAPAGDLTPAEHQEARRNYAAMCENIDRRLGDYLDLLEERDELDDTLVVFTSDHGEMLGDHGRWRKQSPHWASMGVPMVVAGPGVESRGAVSTPVSLIDLYATFVEAAGLDVPGHVDSRSLWPVLRGEADSHREVAHSGFAGWRAVHDGRHTLVVGYDPSPIDGRDDGRQCGPFIDEHDVPADVRTDCDPVLWDTETGEGTNLAPDRPGTVARLRERIERNRREGRDPAP